MNNLYLYGILLLLIYILYAFINIFLNTLISVIVVLVVIYYLLRLICYCLVYPGSFKLYQRINQNHYGIVQAKRVQHYVQQIEAVLNKTEDPESINQIMIWLEFQSRVFSSLQSHSPEQLSYANAIKNLLNLLRTTHQGAELFQQLRKGQVIEKQIQENLKHSIEIIYNIANLHLVELNKFDSFKRWCYLELFGGLNEMRTVIQVTNTNAKRIMIVNGRNKIDCMFLMNSNLNNTVLFCNPNGGYYEYMYYDCNWFRYYEMKNVNVIVWNYRNYGQSTGKLNPKTLQQDAQIIVNYFREHFNIQRFGIHGYSLGGSIASEIAVQNNLDFLIVDRSFSSLGQIASKCFNSQLRFLLNLLTDWDKPHYMSYWNFRGQKLIIQDSKDEVIPYEAQLQVAIAKEWFSPYKDFSSLLDKESEGFQKFFNSNILNRQQMKILSESFERIVQLFHKLQHFEENQENQEQHGAAIPQRVNNKQNYVEFITDDELERLQGYLYSLIEILLKLRYNGTSLTDLLLATNGNNIEKIQSYFACCFTFGMQGEQNFITQFQEFKQNIEKLLEESNPDHENINTDVKIIVDQMSKIVERFSEYLEEPQQTLNDSSRQVSIEMKLAANSITKIGKLLNVNCGHNNNLSEQDFESINQFLRQVGIN